MKKIFLLAISLCLFMAGCTLKEEGKPPADVSQSEPTTKPIATPTVQELEINFSESGNILNWDAQKETYTDTWRLLYEKPGNPALSVELVFNENSTCDGSPCSGVNLNNGDRAKIEGYRDNNRVTVITLTKL